MSVPHAVMLPFAEALDRLPTTLRWFDLTQANQTQANQTQPQISERDRALAYGDGLFATLRVRGDGQVAFIASHVERLVQGAFRLGFWLDSNDITKRLAAAGMAHPGAGLKLLISRGEGGRGYLPPERPTPLAILSAFELPAHYRDWQQQGLALVSSELRLARQPKLAGMKHLNRLEQVLIRRQRLPEWAQDFLVLDCAAELVESSMANLCFIKDQTAFFPHHGYAGVSGVMRQQLMQALLSLGFRIEAKPLYAEMLAQAESVLMSNSLMGVLAVKRINQFTYSEFAAIDKVRAMLDL